MKNEIINDSTDSTEIANTEKPIIYASSLIRLVANIIDFIILALGYLVLGKLIGTGFFQSIIGSVMIMSFYLWFWNKKQATPGKMLFSMKIVEQHTNLSASKEKYLLRFIILYAPFLITLILDGLVNSILDNWKIFNILFSSIFTILTIILISCFISIFLSRKNQGIHDNLLGLSVIYK